MGPLLPRSAAHWALKVYQVVVGEMVALAVLLVRRLLRAALAEPVAQAQVQRAETDRNQITMN